MTFCNLCRCRLLARQDVCRRWSGGGAVQGSHHGSLWCNLAGACIRWLQRSDRLALLSEFAGQVRHFFLLQEHQRSCSHLTGFSLRCSHCRRRRLRQAFRWHAPSISNRVMQLPDLRAAASCEEGVCFTDVTPQTCWELSLAVPLIATHYQSHHPSCSSARPLFSL